MEKDIVDGKIGEVGAYDVEFKGGKLVAKADLSVSEPIPGVEVKAGVSISISAESVIDAIAKAVPGQIDDVLLGLLKGALLK